MDNSASSTRDRRATETAVGLRTEARRLSAERGLTGFTIEELCSEVGVSRRTFFNYFASKENAVLGIPIRVNTADIDDRFLSGGGNLTDDFAELSIARWEMLGLTSADGEEMGRIFRREPRLFALFVELQHERERDDVALVRRRPDAPVDELASDTLVRVFGALLRAAIFEYFADDTLSFRALLLDRLRAARSVFSC